MRKTKICNVGRQKLRASLAMKHRDMVVIENDAVFRFKERGGWGGMEKNAEEIGSERERWEGRGRKRGRVG